MGDALRPSRRHRFVGPWRIRRHDYGFTWSRSGTSPEGVWVWHMLTVVTVS